jgi:hypothetical protein
LIYFTSQTRWYVEEVYRKKRLFGAIELSSFPFQTKAWKRLGYLRNNSVVNIEDSGMQLIPLDLECSSSRLRENVEVFYFYQRILFLQSSSLSIASSNSIHQEIYERARIHLSNCLNFLTKPKSENNSSLDGLESLLTSSFHGFHSFTSHQFIQAQKYSFQELLSLSATHRFYSELNSLPLLYQHCELILFSQLLFLNNLQSTKDFLGKLLQQSILHQSNGKVDEESYFQLKEERFFTNFLFLCHLIEGKLFLWDFSEGNEESSQDEKTLVFKECSKAATVSIYCRFPMDEKSFESIYLGKFREEHGKGKLLMSEFIIFYERFAGFHQIYSAPFPADQDSPSVLPLPPSKNPQNLFQDLLQKYENILKKIQSFSQLTTEGQGKLRRFYREQYHPMYTNMIVLNYLNLGLSDYSWKYFENQFLFSIVSRGLYDSGLSSIEEVVENRWETVLRSLFPGNQMNTVLQDLVSCEQMESFYKNSSLFRTAFDLYTFLQPKETTTTAEKRTIDRNRRVEALLTEPFLFNNYMMILSQTMNPMILSSVPVLSSAQWSWVSEALLYRLFFVDILDALHEYCSSGVGSSAVACRQFNDDTLSVLVRGFFLEAYQGVNLLEQFYRKYYEVVGSTTVITASDEEENSFYQNLLFPKLKDYSTTTRFLQLMNYSQFFSSSSALKTNLHDATLSASQIKKKKHHHRIGIVCYSLSRHSVGRLMAKVIDSLQADDEFFELFIFTNQPHSTSFSASSDQSNLRNPLTASDDITKYLMKIIPSSHWIDLTTRSASSLSFSSSNNPIGERIKSFQLDILIYTDLLMQSSQYSFAYSERYAETQMIFWGHPYTTSNPFIDYYVTSSLFEPNNPNLVRNDQFTEQLIYFDSLSFQLFPPQEGARKETPNDQFVEEEKVEGTPQSLKDKYHLELIQNRKIFLQNTLSNVFTLQGNLYSSQYNYSDFINAFSQGDAEDGSKEEQDENDFLVSLHFYGALQSLMKMHPLFDSTILQLLQKGSRAVIFLLKNNQQFHWQLNWQKRLFGGLSHFNLTYDDVKHRLFFVPPMKSSDYSQFLCSLGIILDSFPFGGGVTMCDSIAGNCVNRVHQQKKNKKNPTSDSMNRYEKYSSIPFISMNELQSIHRIGIGIAQRVNRSDLTTIIEDKRHSVDQIIDYMENKQQMKSNTKNNRKSLLLLFHEYTQELIEEYVGEAMKLVNYSNQRFLRSLPQPSLLENSNEEMNMNDPYWAIYEDTHATEEWKQLLKRILK